MEEEVYWKGLLGALDDQTTTLKDSDLVINSNEQTNSNSVPSTAITNNANRELTSKSIETVSAFVDVDLEDEQQYYFKYYKEYFETSYGSTPDQKEEPTLSTVDVWCEGNKVSTSYNFVILSENEVESEDSRPTNTDEITKNDDQKYNLEGFAHTDGTRITVNEEKTTNPSIMSASPLSILNNYIPRFVGIDHAFQTILYSLSSSNKSCEKYLDDKSKTRTLVSFAMDTVVFAKDKVVDHVSNYFRTNFYISSFVGCVSESAIFLADRVKTTSHRYVNQLTADDPEQMHLEKVKNSLKWNHIFLRYSMASLSWKERQLIEETQNEGMMEGLWQHLPRDKGFRKLLDGTNAVTGNGGLHQSLVAEVGNGGDEATLYALEKFFTAPAFEEKSACAACCKPFNLALFRHHCRNCGRSFCDEHSKSRRCIFRFGLVEAVRVCSVCCASIDEVHRRDGLIWKECRVNAYLTDRLIPYFNPIVDRGIDKALRVADYSIIVAKNTLTLNYPTKIVLETVDILKRYGLAGFAGLLLRKDFMDSVETLKRISGMDTMFSTSIHELTACIYYKLAIERGIRGCNATKEFDDHCRLGMQLPVDCDRVEQPTEAMRDSQCEEVRNEDLNEVIRLAPLALKIAYEKSSVDCQRLARLLGWETLFSNADESLSLQVEQPCYALLATSHQLLENPPIGRPVRKEAVLAIRGTQTMQDVVTDIRAIPEEFNPSPSALWAAMKGLPRPSQRQSDNEEEDFDAYADEHSDEETTEPEPGSECELMQQWEWLRGSSHLPPVDESGVPIELKKYACGGMSRAAMNLLREVGPSLMKLHLAGYAIKVVGHSLGGAVAAMLTYLLMSVKKWSRPLDIKCVTYGCPSCVDATIADLLAEKGVVISAVLHDDVISRITPQSIRFMMQELMYFRQQVFHHIKQDWSDVLSRSMSLWSPRTRDGRQLYSHSHSNHSAALAPLAAAAETSPDGEGLLVQDMALLDLWIPGKIIHIFSHNGQYRACMVPRNFPDIRRIVLQCNMFEDHRSKNILDALLSVKAVREADRTNGSGGPRLVPYDASNTCQCCNHSFTWHSTFRGQAQEYRERYNCKYCGGLVCGPCSSNKRAMPAFGFIFPRRICDACLYKGEYGNVYTV